MRYRISLLISVLIHGSLLAAALLIGVLRSPHVVIEINPDISSINMDASGDASEVNAAAPVKQAAPSEASAPRLTNARTANAAPVNKGTSSGASSSTSGSSIVLSYLAEVRNRLSREIRSPQITAPSPLRAVLKLTLKNTGEVENATLEQSSGSADFDRSVLDALQRAKPFPPFNAQMAGMPDLTAKLPIEVRFRP